MLNATQAGTLYVYALYSLRPTTIDPAASMIGILLRLAALLGCDVVAHLSLSYLHGRVDLRASVTDTPRRLAPIDPAIGGRFPEHGQAPAAIRAYLAPLSRRGRHVVAYRVFIGATTMPAAAVRTTWAAGTWRTDACNYHWKDPKSTCVQHIIWHTARAGFDTRRVPNGDYLWCVQALTINNVDARRCVPVTIDK
jgi:hypothetical protein